MMMQVPFGDKDQCGEFTLRHGDWVQFQVATDRRDQLKRATNISLLDESFNVSGERSEFSLHCVFVYIVLEFQYVIFVVQEGTGRGMFST